jgi:SnoaL-like domain
LDEESGRLNLDDVDLETLRDAFVEAFNARDLETILDLVADDVETPDLLGEGRDALSDELEAVWEDFPEIIVTRAVVDGRPSAMAWRADDDASWSPSMLFTFDDGEGLLVLVEMTDHPDELERATADDPEDEPPDEEVTWPGWDRAEDSRDISYPLRIVEGDSDQETEEQPDTAWQPIPRISDNP